MIKLNNNDKGFSVFEILAIIIVFGLIGVVGYFVYKNQHQPAKIVTTTKKITPSANITNSNLKTFNWTYEGLTIRYPSTWTFLNLPKTSNPDYANSPIVIIKSNVQQTANGYVSSFDGGKTEPYDGAFHIELSVGSLSDNNCNVADNSNSDATNSDHIVKIIPVTIPNYKAMNIIEDGGYNMTSASEIVITDSPVKLGVTTSPYKQDIYSSKKHAGQYVCVSSGFFGESKTGPGNFNYVTMPLSDFENMPDYNNGLNAIKSISY